MLFAKLFSFIVFCSLFFSLKPQSAIIQDKSINNIGENKTRDRWMQNPSKIKFPAIPGNLLIDGVPDELFWQSAYISSLENPRNNYFGEGGEVRTAVRGAYLCISATIPETSRIIARSTGANPTWEREDMVAWRLKYVSPIDGNSTFLVLAVNPFGAVSLFKTYTHFHGSIGDDVINSLKRQIGAHGSVITGGDYENLTGTPLEWVDEILISSFIGNDKWSIELAIPIKNIDSYGFMSIERVRAPRPDAPELSWYWPAPNVRQYYELETGQTVPEPLFQPTLLPQNEFIINSEKPKNDIAREIASLPKQVWSKEEQDSIGIRIMYTNYLRKRVKASAEAEAEAWKKVKSVNDWEHFRDIRLKFLHEWIGDMPAKTPLFPEVTRRLNFGEKFIIENLVYESQPGLLVTANLYLPEHVSGKIPAIILVHAHHAPKTQTELQDIGMTLARSGTAVLVPDQLCGGERSQSQPLWARESYYNRYTTGNQLYLAGESLIKWMAWDIIRSIDVLLMRPFIDPERIILIGAVAGGGDPAALTATLDPRISAVIPFNFGEAGPEEHYTMGPRPFNSETADPGWGSWETTRNLPNSIDKQFFPWFLCVAGAPRPFTFAFEMEWPQTVEQEPVWTRYKKVYEFYNSPQNLTVVDGLGSFPGAGETNQISTYHRQQIDTILNSWFQMPFPKSEYHNLRPEKELLCITPEVAIKRNLVTVASVLLKNVTKKLSKVRSNYENLGASGRRNEIRVKLAEKLGDIEPVIQPLVKNIWRKEFSKFTIDAHAVEIEKDLILPIFLLKPRKINLHGPAVIALAEGGKEQFLTHRVNEISTLLNNGFTICIPDLRGMGELSASTSRAPGAMALASTELMLGNTQAGMRLKDTRTILHWLSGIENIDPKKISLWGDSFSIPNSQDFKYDQSPGQKPGPVPQRQAEPLGPFLAALTALQEDQISSIVLRGGLISFKSVLEDRFCHIPQDIIVPGFLEIADISDILQSIPDCKIFMEKMIDGRNIRVSTIQIQEEYQNNPGNIFFTDNESQSGFTEWLVNIYK